MWELIKKYWDIVSGVASGILLAVIAKFELDTVQLYYSIIILMLVSIGCLRIIKQAIETQRKKRKPKDRHSVIDGMVDGQKPVKAISLATEPTKEGEKLGSLIIILIGGLKKIMNKFKELFDKFKGIALTIALALLTMLESGSNFINELFGEVFTFRGDNLLLVAMIGLTAVVGILSNSFTKEQIEKIKALFAKSTTDEIVVEEIKKTIKTDGAELTQLNKTLAMKETELENFNGELEAAKNTHNAKIAMFNMTPRLASDEDVRIAANAVVAVETKISQKKAEIAEIKKSIEEKTEHINALKSKL